MAYEQAYIVTCDCEDGTVIAYGPVSGRNVMRAYETAASLPGVERAATVPVYSIGTLRIDAQENRP